MGSAQSFQERDNAAANDDDDEEEEEEEEEEGERENATDRSFSDPLLMKLLQQEPEILPCHASASPLSPQPSAVGTPRLGPSIKVWDPCHVLSAAPPPPFFTLSAADDDRTVEFYLIAHGECEVSLRPELVGGRWPSAALTADGNRQSRALAVYLKSQGVRLNAVYSSPLDRARTTATSVCRELGFPEGQIQSSEVLVEMSQGQWEGCLRSEIFTPEIVSYINKSQPDFSPPSGESLRQVEFRMIEFLNSTLSRLSKKYTLTESPLQNGNNGLSRSNSENLTSPVQDGDGPVLLHYDLLSRPHRPCLSRKISGKSRLQFVTMGDNLTDDSFSAKESSNGHLNEMGARSFSIGVFTHATPIKCVLTAVLGCSPAMIHRICIDDSSTTVLQHSIQSGWQLKRLNDTSHLRLL